MFDFANQHILITGASGGIGRALIALFGAAGAQITAIDRNPEPLTAPAVRDQLTLELTDGIAIRAALAELIVKRGAPTIVISNAGGTAAESFAHLSDEAFEQELSANLTGAYRIIDSCLPAMKLNGGGAIVAVSSVNALAHFGNPAYAAAKAGLLAYIRALAVELGREGIRANAVCPGSVMTPAWDHRFAKDPSLRTKIMEHYPLNRLVTPQEVANTIAFLASSFASGITGTSVNVDAGLMAGNLRFVRHVIGGEA